MELLQQLQQILWINAVNYLAAAMDTSNMNADEVEAYIRGMQHLQQQLQQQLQLQSPLLAALISSTIPQSPLSAALSAARAASAANSEIGSIPEEEESPISVSAPSPSTISPSSIPDMASVTSADPLKDLNVRILLTMLQQQIATSTAVSTAASMPNLLSIGSIPFSMPPPTTVPSSLNGLSLFSTTPSTSTLLEQQLAFQSSLMRPRVNSAASSSTSSSSLSSPNPTSSPERRRKRARSLLIKAEEAAAKVQDAKLKRSDALAELIEDEQQRRELAASVMAASANGTLTTLKSSTSPATKGLLDEFPKITLRPLIPDAQLPDTVGPDSPYRHHPKYQKKIADSATDFNLGMSLASFSLNKDAKKDGEDSGASSTSSSLSSLQGNPEALKMMLSKFMDDVISGELVASN